MSFLMTKKFLFIFLFVVASVFIFLLLRQGDKYKVSISAPAGAEIFVAKDRDSSFESVGKTNSTYSQNQPGTVFVRTVLNGGETRASVELTEEAVAEISLNIVPPLASRRVSDGPLSHLYFEGDFIYGINPNTKALSFINKNNSPDYPDVSFLSSPYTNKVSWKNTKNYTYNSLQYGVQDVVKGELWDNLGGGGEQYTPKFYNFTRYSSKPLVLLGPNSIYLTKNFKTQPQAIIDFEVSGAIFLFSDKESFYVVQTLMGEDHSSLKVISNSLFVYDYDGDKLARVELPDNTGQVLAVLNINKDEYLLLSEFGLYSISAGSTTPSLVQLYDQNTKDMLMVGDEVYLLSTSGLWLYNQTDDTLSLVSGFPENEIYVPDSLTYVDGGFAFSSILTDAALRDIDTPLSSSSIYFVTLE